MLLKRIVTALSLCFLSLPVLAQTAAEPAAAAVPAAAAAATAPATEEGEPVPQQVLVSGSRPGPGVW